MNVENAPFIQICGDYPRNVIDFMVYDGFMLGARDEEKVRKWLKFPRSEIDEMADVL